jgi:outer membrane lipoprotein-sorting protein
MENVSLNILKKFFVYTIMLIKKILVSNGSSLVIETNNKGSYYRYPLNKTPLEFLLDKEYLISKIEELEPRDIDNKYLNFKIFENNNEINIFFDKKDLNLIGWQTEDIYQNLSITFISSIKKNQEIDEIFLNYLKIINHLIKVSDLKFFIPLAR